MRDTRRSHGALCLYDIFKPCNSELVKNFCNYINPKNFQEMYLFHYLIGHGVPEIRNMMVQWDGQAFNLFSVDFASIFSYRPQRLSCVFRFPPLWVPFLEETREKILALEPDKLDVQIDEEENSHFRMRFHEMKGRTERLKKIVQALPQLAISDIHMLLWTRDPEILIHQEDLVQMMIRERKTMSVFQYILYPDYPSLCFCEFSDENDKSYSFREFVDKHLTEKQYEIFIVGYKTVSLNQFIETLLQKMKHTRYSKDLRSYFKFYHTLVNM